MSIDRLRPYARRLAERAEQRAHNWMLANDPSRDDYRDAIPIFSGVYAQSAGLLAADWYNTLNEDSQFQAVLDDDLDPTKLDNVADWVFAGPQTPANRGRLAAHRLVFDAVRRTVFVSAAAEGVAIARDEQAGSCDKCIARATLSPRERTDGSADVEQDFHPRCEGLFVPVRTGVYEPPPHTRVWRLKVAAAHDAGNTTPDGISKWLQDHG